MAEHGITITDFLNQRMDDFMNACNAAEKESFVYIDEL